MNYKIIARSLGRILLIEAALLVVPLIVSFIYNDGNWHSFVTTIAILAAVGVLLNSVKPTSKQMFVREGFIIVGAAWILLSLFGCLPFLISGEIPNFFNAFFETVSGFTTTGATILTDVEAMSKSMLFWRSFTHWIGGMGVLVFVLAILPNSEGQNIYLLKAESTGPQVGKLVSKVRFTARILYLIYFVLTLIMIGFMIAGNNPIFDSVVISLGTAGTGGFAVYADGMARYSTYTILVISIFMTIFGINFNVYYLIIIGKIKQAFKCEEMHWYLGVITLSTVLIAINLVTQFEYTWGLAFRDSFFQVSSIITTTGFSNTDFNLWPTLSKVILVLLMFVGGCAGSTAGGIKVSRIVILFKTLRREIKKLIHPNVVAPIKFEGETMDEEVVKGISGYFALVMALLALTIIIISIDGHDFATTFTAAITCINNVGPGLNLVGPMGSFDVFSNFSKFILSIVMLIGRLEVYPILILFLPKMWANK